MRVRGQAADGGPMVGNSEMPDLRTTPTLPPDAKLTFAGLVEEAGHEDEGEVPGEADGQLPSRKCCQRLASCHLRHAITKILAFHRTSLATSSLSGQCHSLLSGLKDCLDSGSQLSEL